MIKKIFYVLLFFTVSILLWKNSPLFAQTATETPTPTASATPTPDTSAAQKELQDKIKQYEQKVSELQGQEKTLSSQIKIMDSQISLTEFRINSAKQKIDDLQKDIEVAQEKIKNIEIDMDRATKAMISRINATYQTSNTNTWYLLLSSDNIPTFLTRLKYLKIVQMNDKKNIYAAEQTKLAFANQQSIFENSQKEQESLKKQLVGYTSQLASEKTAKEGLLSVTKSDETRYQKLLQEARAQINAFKSFASSQMGGSSILPPQASPDGWYYNQRDERWARHSIGSSSDQVWDVGCLLTSVTMVLKKHGQNITPADTAADSSYFFSDTAYMLIPWAAGKFTAVWGANLNAIDNKLASGEPVIVGVRAGTYGMHFIVLKSGSSGSYIMNDPWYGPDLNFSSHYTTGQIFQYGYYNG